jgi:hypothetical protein
MEPEVKRLATYLASLGVAGLTHTDRTYLAHSIGVYRGLKRWTCGEDICRAGFFHSIYGTQQFRDFALPLGRRAELRSFIGEHAETIVFANCFMDRDTLDAQIGKPIGPYTLINRVTGDAISLSKAEFDDLVCVHLCDRLETLPRARNWNYRRAAYRQMAERLGGVALADYRSVLALESRKRFRNLGSSGIRWATRWVATLRRRILE